MYLSNPVMMSPSTSVTTRNEMVHGVIVQQTHLQLYTQSIEDVQGAAGAGSVRQDAGRRWCVAGEFYEVRDSRASCY